MYVCEKSLAPHELGYLGLFKLAHSIFFHVIVISKNSPKNVGVLFLFLELKL
jgi:hypothetical protein